MKDSIANTLPNAPSERSDEAAQWHFFHIVVHDTQVGEFVERDAVSVGAARGQRGIDGG